MITRNKTFLIGGALAVVATTGAGVLLGRSLLAPAQSHVGETVAQHAAELQPQTGAAAPAGEAEAEHGKSVHMTAEALKQSGIAVETLSPASLADEIVAQATVVSAPDGEAVLTARAGGSIASIRKQLGDAVARGEAVALVTSGEAAGLAASRSAAKAKFEQAKSAADREQRLFDQHITARQDLEAAQADLASADAEYRRAAAAADAAHVSSDGSSVFIASPIAGRISEVTANAKLGAFVATDTVLFRISDPAKIQIEAAVPLVEAQHIKAGDEAVVETPTGGKVTAKVRSVTPAGSAENRTATIVLSIAGGSEALQPGRFARVVIRSSNRIPTEGAFVVPDEAVQSQNGQTIVFIRSEEGFDAVQVRTGERSGGRTEIVAGLTAGQVVATRNAFLLKAELGKGSAEHED